MEPVAIFTDGRKGQKAMRRKHTTILELCRNGERLSKTITTNRAGNPVTAYCLEPSGAHVTESQALNLLRSGKFVPVGDGLLGTRELADLATKAVTTNREFR